MRLKILDLTTRLPGPLACNQLQKLGHEVTRIEWIESPDPFNIGDGENDPIFKLWHQNFNKDKIKFEYSFKDFDPKELEQFDLVIYSPNKLYKEFFSNKIKRVEVLGGKELKYLHDLNALSLSTSFNLNSGELPHLPFAGIIYAQSIALHALNFIHDKENIHKKLYLSDISTDLLDLFWSPSLGESSQHLHTGKFPCYNIYRSADKKLIAFAAVEERFWLKFNDLFKLNLELKDRFDTSNSTKNIITQCFAKLSLNEIKKTIGDEDICITFLPH